MCYAQNFNFGEASTWVSSTLDCKHEARLELIGSNNTFSREY
jgi:hypothetical protein